MKIFNWVQKKLHQNIIRDGLVKNVKKTESIAIDNNTQTLLEQVAIIDVLDCWKDGILTIGTFGFDPLKPCEVHEEPFLSESYEYEVGVDRDISYKDGGADDQHDGNDIVSSNCFQDDEANPLMLAAFGDDLKKVRSVSQNQELSIDAVFMAIDGVELTPIPDNDREKKKRTTLADLFLADSESTKIHKPASEFGKKELYRSTNDLFRLKKLTSLARDEDSRPIRKLGQMMKRMMKRKIHPVSDAKMANKVDGQNKPADRLPGDAEFVSLLKISESTV